MDGSETAVASGKPDRRSPALAPSKRDRKRQVLMDRLSAMNDRFQRDRDLTYRDQLSKIQYEASLVQRLDPYSSDALDRAGDLLNEYHQAQGPPVLAESSRSLLDMAGIVFPDFVNEVEDLIELRDYQLAQTKNEYERKVQEYKNTRTFKIETAQREHRALNATLRDRLVNTLTYKKNRLNREKEVLEINDSNALLLNPNQFSITNPASPGGAHGKRATRLRKDAEDLSLFPDSKKRKRNPGEDDGSPAPLRRAMDPGSTTALWQSEKARVAAKQNGPLYSIDKLFTDKELSLHYNSAALASYQYVLRNRSAGQPSLPGESGETGHCDDNSNGNNNNNNNNNNSTSNDSSNEKDDAESQPSAPAMERQVSHATRSTRGAATQNLLDDKILGIEGIASFEIPANLDLIHSIETPKMPPPVPQQYLKPYPRTSDQNYPVALSQEDVSSDLAVIGYFKQYDMNNRPGAHLDASTGLRKILEAVAVPYHQGRYVAFTGAPRQSPEQIRDALGIPTSSLRDEADSLAVPMSRQSSQGGVAMSRQASGRGKSRR